MLVVEHSVLSVTLSALCYTSLTWTFVSLSRINVEKVSTHKEFARLIGRLGGQDNKKILQEKFRYIRFLCGCVI